MRLIDADALIQHTYSAVVDGVKTDIIDASDVDSAPTVDAYTIEDVRDLIGLLEKRLQGEWKVKNFDEETGISDNCWCPFCGMVKAQVYNNFCGNCGADMRKETSNGER